jgi:hypothetical protein
LFYFVLFWEVVKLRMLNCSWKQCLVWLRFSLLLKKNPRN